MADYPPQSAFQVEPALAGRLAAAKEAVWFRIGVLQSAMNDRERALEAFERVLAVNPANVRAMTQAGAVLAKKECYPQAVAYLQRAISADSTCGEAWAVLAHCYVMTDDLQKAYQAYQSALSHLPNPRDPNLWYGIGLLYDRYGSLDHALEAFLAVLSISPDFERADEVCFCIGIIYKEQQNFDEALKYFNKVVVAANPPPPLTRADGWYQIGHVNELKRDIPVALDMYRHALAENPKHPKTLQNFGWLEHQHNENSNEAIRLLKLSAELDPADGQTWYLLGRVFMALREYRQAYDAYQQAVYRDGRNATFWCSIGVLYYQMNQFRDAMDAYSRAIRLNPYVSEVWYDLGTLYESCAQNADAIDAYRRAAELAPENTQITARLGVLENPVAQQQQTTGQPQHSAQQPQPQMPPQQMQPDMHHPNQQHMQSSQLNPVLGRQIAPPIHQLSQPLGQQKLSHHQPASLPPSQLPPTQQGPLPSQPGQQGSNTQNAVMSGPQRSGPMEITPIAALRPHNLSQSQPMGQNGSAFSQDGRPSLPAPPAPVQHSASHTAGMNHLSPMVSQPLHSQPQSNVLPPPVLNASQQEPIHAFRHRPGPMPDSQLQPLAHHPPTDPSHRHHGQLPHPDPQQQGPLPQINASQPTHHGQTHGPLQGEMQQQSHMPQQSQNQNSSPHVQTQDPSSHQQQPQSQHPQGQHPPQVPRPQQQQSPHSQSQPPRPHPMSNGLPQIQALPQLQALPQMQPTQQQPDNQKRSDSQAHLISEPQRHRTPHGQENDRPPFMQSQGDSLRGPDFSRGDEQLDNRLSKIAKPEGLPSSQAFRSSADGIAGSQPMYASGQGPVPPMSTSGNRIPALRDPGGDVPSTAPLPARSMAMHEITQPEPLGQQRRPEDGNREELQQGDRTRTEPHTEKGPMPERLPAVGSLTGQMNVPTRDSREDARLLTSVAAPPLSIPASNPSGSMDGESQKPATSPQAPPGEPTSSGLGTNAPALPPMPSRPTPSLSGIGPDNKEGSSSIGPSAVGVSSLTKFGKGLARTPATPVNSSVAPSSLPSPLPARKGPTGPVVRSPRISKPSNVPSFKPVPIPPISAPGIGHIESVPSPSSLPVLPALPSHPNNNGNDKPPSKEKSIEQETAKDGESDTRAGRSKPDEKSAKDTSGGRKSDDGVINKPLFGILRSALAPEPPAHRDRPEKEKVTSPTLSAPRQDSESVSTLKREATSKDEPGRTPKRPRLHDINEPSEQKAFSGFSGDDNKKTVGNMADAERNDGDGVKSGVPGPVKSEIPSFKELKGVTSTAQPTEPEKPGKRDGTGRSMDVDGGNLPRLSNPMSRSGPPPLAGTLPSFRSERMKSTTQDATSRPFALRSTPLTSLSTPLKSHVPSSSRVDRNYGSSQAEEPVGKRMGEDKAESGNGGNGSRDELMSDRVTNGETQKSGGSGEPEARTASEMSPKEEKQSGRTEIPSSAT